MSERDDVPPSDEVMRREAQDLTEEEVFDLLDTGGSMAQGKPRIKEDEDERA